MGNEIEISEQDKEKIFELYFKKMFSMLEIQHYFNDKYKYSQISNLIYRKIGGYNGYTVTTTR